MSREFKTGYDAVEYVIELTGARNYPVVSDHFAEMIVKRFYVVDKDGFRTDNLNYKITVDIFSAAAEIFGVKAGYASTDYDFKTDNQSFSRSQVVQHLLDMQKFYKSKTYGTLDNNVMDYNSRLRLNTEWGCQDC